MYKRFQFHAKAQAIFLVSLLALLVVSAAAQTTNFTYQGKLTNNGNPANGVYDFEVKLFDALSAGNQLSTTITLEDVQVTNGIFTVQLDFGNQFTGANRYLEIAVRGGASTGAFTLLSPRQQITSTPHAIKSLNATTADGLSVACINCVTSSQIQSVQGSQVTGNIAGSQINGAIPVASVPPGSASYIQNSTALQPASNFNISGNGTLGGTLSAAIVNTLTSYRINDIEVLRINGENNVFVGMQAGQINAGTDNTFVGRDAGLRNLYGSNNAFFGRTAGRENDGSNNSFFGRDSGNSNTIGNDNCFFGYNSGYYNTNSSNNSFFGTAAGMHSIGEWNSFFGRNAGLANGVGNGNSFFGVNAGHENDTGNENAAFGVNAGFGNRANFNAFFGGKSGESTFTGANNAFFGHQSGRQNRFGDNNSFFGKNAGASNSNGDDNTFVGYNTGFSNVSGSNISLLGAATNVGNDALTFATAIGAGAVVNTSNTVTLGRTSDTVQAPGNLTVTGTLTANGTVIANLNANTITSGTLNNARLGVIPVSNGGTGLNATGAAGNFLRSNGTSWLSAALQVADIPNLSASYIQNSTALQPASNFNISGNGIAGGTLSAGSINASTQYNIGGGSRVLGVIGSNNLFVGVGAGQNNNSGTDNTFAGINAGGANQTGSFNAFFGSGSGGNTTSSNNAFFGNATGAANSSGGNNSFFGNAAGFRNTFGNGNTFLGTLAGNNNTTGNFNIFIGQGAGSVNDSGEFNVIIGSNSGSGNVSGNRNTFIGAFASGGTNLDYATAIGAGASVSSNNTIALGRNDGSDQTVMYGNSGIGTTAPQSRLHIQHPSISGNQWGVQIQNSAQATFRAGMRLANGGFFEVSNNILVANPNFARLDSNGNWTAVSDARLKHDIAPLSGLLDKALALRPVSFHFKNQPTAHKEIGFIAQEVEALLPSLVTDGAVKTLNYSGLSVVAIGAIQEQQQQLHALQAANRQLQEQLTQQQRQLEEFKKLLCALQPTAAICRQ